MGETRAVFHSLGSSPEVRDTLNSLVTAGVILRAVFFSMIAVMLSWPFAVVVSIARGQEFVDLVFATQ